MRLVAYNMIDILGGIKIDGMHGEARNQIHRERVENNLDRVYESRIYSTVEYKEFMVSEVIMDFWVDAKKCDFEIKSYELQFKLREYASTLHNFKLIDGTEFNNVRGAVTHEPVTDHCNMRTYYRLQFRCDEVKEPDSEAHDLNPKPKLTPTQEYLEL